MPKAPALDGHKSRCRVASRERSLAQLPNWLADGPLGWVGSNARGSAQPHLQGKDLEETLIYFPSLEKQKMAVARIERAFSWIDRLASEATSARKIIDHLDQ